MHNIYKSIHNIINIPIPSGPLNLKYVEKRGKNKKSNLQNEKSFLD